MECAMRQPAVQSAIPADLLPYFELALSKELADAPPILNSADLAKILGTTAGNLRQIRRRHPDRLPVELDRGERAVATWSKTGVAIWIARRNANAFQEPARRGRKSTAQKARAAAQQESAVVL
jgi:hypothetical protein